MRLLILSLILSVLIFSCEEYNPDKQAVKTKSKTPPQSGTDSTGTKGTATTESGSTGTTGKGTLALLWFYQ